MKDVLAHHSCKTPAIGAFVKGIDHEPFRPGLYPVQTEMQIKTTMKKVPKSSSYMNKLQHNNK